MLENGKLKKLLLSNNVSLFDIIKVVVGQEHCSRLIILTYSISDEALRHLDDLKSEGKVDTVVLIMDKSVIANKFNLLTYAENVVDEIYTLGIHAKMVLFDNALLMSSANLNRVKRFEFFSYHNDMAMVEYAREEIEEIIKQADKIK